MRREYFQMWTRTIVLLLCLLMAVAMAQQQDNTQVESRKGHVHAYRYWTKLLYYALPYIFAFKVKVVIVAVAVTLFVLKLWYPFGFGGAGGYTSYEAPGAWSEYPGKERQLSGYTERVMRGLETAELTWRAATEDETSGCAARLACEARQAARSDNVAARMVSALGSSLTELERSGRSEDCEVLGCKLSLLSAFGYNTR